MYLFDFQMRQLYPYLVIAVCLYTIVSSSVLRSRTLLDEGPFENEVAVQRYDPIRTHMLRKIEMKRSW